MDSGLEKLAAFGLRCLQESREFSGDLDGGDLQEWALQAGCLESRTVTEPCTSEGCVCAEVSDFPTECYFVAPDVLACYPKEAATNA